MLCRRWFFDEAAEWAESSHPDIAQHMCARYRESQQPTNKRRLFKMISLLYCGSIGGCWDSIRGSFVLRCHFPGKVRLAENGRFALQMHCMQRCNQEEKKNGRKKGRRIRKRGKVQREKKRARGKKIINGSHFAVIHLKRKHRDPP